MRQAANDNIQPRGLNRVQASAYAGVSPSLFDMLVKSGVMPQPIRWGGRNVYDKVAIDRVFEKKPEKEEKWEFAV